jgi:hypothetical protein
MNRQRFSAGPWLAGALALLVLPTIAHAQLWQTTVPYFSNIETVLLLETRPGGYRVLSSNVQLVNGVSHAVRLIDFDENTGAVTAQASTPLAAGARRLVRALPANDGGGYVAAGYHEGPPDFIDSALVVKIAPDGAVLWEKFYEPQTRIHFFEAVGSSGYLAIVRPSSGDSWSFLRVDNDGSVVWQQPVTVPAGYTLSRLNVLPSGEIWVATNAFTSSNPGANILRFDPAGQLLATYAFNNSLYGGFLGKILPLSDGNLALGGSTFTLSNGNEAWIVKVEPDGDVLWERTLGTWNGDGIADLRELSDGSIGFTGGYGSFWPGGALLLGQLDATTGALLQERYYGHIDTSATGFWLTEGPNQALVAAGLRGNQTYIVKDQFPTISTHAPAPLLTCRAWPNPATDRVEVRLENGRVRRGELQLYDQRGALVRRLVWRGNTETVERGALSAGLYRYALLDGKGVVAAGTIVFQ